MDDKTLDRLRGILAEAKLPWRTDLCNIVRDDPNDDDPWTVAHCGSGEGNEAVIVEVLNAAPQLLDTIEAQVTRIEALEAELGNEKAHYETAQANWDLCLDRIEALEAALHFYADWHSQPSEGPWGANSKDFGDVARKALEGTGNG